MDPNCQFSLEYQEICQDLQTLSQKLENQAADYQEAVQLLKVIQAIIPPLDPSFTLQLQKQANDVHINTRPDHESEMIAEIAQVLLKVRNDIRDKNLEPDNPEFQANYQQLKTFLLDFYSQSFPQKVSNYDIMLTGLDLINVFLEIQPDPNSEMNYLLLKYEDYPVQPIIQELRETFQQLGLTNSEIEKHFDQYHLNQWAKNYLKQPQHEFPSDFAGQIILKENANK